MNDEEQAAGAGPGPEPGGPDPAAQATEAALAAAEAASAQAAAAEGAAAEGAAAEGAAAEGAAAEAEIPGQPEGPQLRVPERPAAFVPAAEARVAELEAQLAEQGRQLQRLVADFENYRRRVASEKDELVSFASGRVLENFLPIVDNFERAMAHLAAADPDALRQGIELIFKQVTDFLGRQGVAAMDAVGQPFDPNLHEAIGQIQTTDHPDNAVMNEVQRGYLLNGRVLRHAMVQVANNPSPAADPVETNQNGAESATMDPSPATTEDHDFTLEDLMAEAQASEGSKEESHG